MFVASMPPYRPQAGPAVPRWTLPLKVGDAHALVACFGQRAQNQKCVCGDARRRTCRTVRSDGARCASAWPMGRGSRIGSSSSQLHPRALAERVNASSPLILARACASSAAQAAPRWGLECVVSLPPMGFTPPCRVSSCLVSSGRISLRAVREHSTCASPRTPIQSPEVRAACLLPWTFCKAGRALPEGFCASKVPAGLRRQRRGCVGAAEELGEGRCNPWGRP